MQWNGDAAGGAYYPNSAKLNDQIAELRIKLGRILPEIRSLQEKRVPSTEDTEELTVLLAKSKNLKEEIQVLRRVAKLSFELEQPVGKPSGLDEIDNAPADHLPSLF